MSIEENQNIEPQTEVEAAPQAEPATTENENTVDWEKRFNDSQSYITRLSEDLKSRDSQLSDLNGKFDSLSKFINIDAINGNQPEQTVFDRIHTAIPQLETTVQTLQSDNQQLRQTLNDMALERQYNSFTDKYTQKFGSEETYAKVEEALVNQYPDMVQQVKAGNRSLEEYMTMYLGSQALDPNSEILKSMAEAQRLQEARKQFNYIPGTDVPGGAQEQSYNPVSIEAVTDL